MPKKSREQIEKDEQQVLKELKKDSSQSVDSIADKCGFSRQKVWRITKKLEKNNDIWGYTAVADDEKLQVESYVVLIKRTTEPLSMELANKIIERTIEPMAQDLDVTLQNSLFTHGAYDWVICLTAPDMTQALKFCDLLSEAYKGYIADVELLEGLFWIRKQGMLNPKKEELKEILR